MLTPIMTPSQTAAMFAEGSASRAGAMIGTTTTAISMKSRKKPRRKITTITIANLAKKPPGKPTRKSRTISSPPKARKAAVSIAAPSRMMKTRDVVFAVSTMTCLSVSLILYARQALQTMAITKHRTAAAAKPTPIASDVF